MGRVARLNTPAWLAALACSLSCAVAALGAQPGSWLDRPLERWNTPGMAVPPAPARASGLDAALRTCAAGGPVRSPAVAAVASAGWVPFLHQDRALVSDDVEIVAGLTALTAICEPDAFNLFVFVGGRFAGTLSPIPMHANRDGVAGAVRITGANAVTSEFSRYAPGDADCCPSGRIRVTYTLTRDPAAVLHASGVESRR